MSTDRAATGLTDQYRSRVAADLESNGREQERLATEIAALQKQLSVLQHEQSVLTHVQEVLGAAPQAQALAADDSSVPPPRKRTPASAASHKATRAKKPTGGNGKPTRKAVPEKASAAKSAVTTPTSSQPTLVELVRDHLAQHHEPRSAAEVAASLGQAHPDRGVKTTVVRSTLEGLVAKNRIQRTRQGSSVFYSAPATEIDDTPAEPQQSAPVEPTGS
ncbi:hypothetical protein [Streptomyces sp. NPDC047000]|uniref:hypothetical protein n=1 Tax=Streptomyces sp. NPDC047000 TaxID=3155474 RepID=UPI003403AFAE